MARLHVVLGPVGAGKTTYLQWLRREKNAVAFDLDDWMAVLYRPDRPEEKSARLAWYVERVERCLEQIWRTALGVLETGTDVVLEVGLVRREQRARFFGKVDADALDLTIHLLDAPREVRRARVEQRNREQGPTFSMEVPMEMFELASDMWEPLDEAETNGRDVRVVS